ncbi:endo-1,4-beta-xylanase [Sphingomonas morindae]|uniref:Beta-xylanase n=1 Tax=Sphingomonas morindae TaxID=1541170 RepID=A0ABY4X6J4_9SPHN|nr:endo-1,4-beta-xylanase [Sphingomonas morindae]USI72469.1 endo-1,4-beta-xylanase [Sphingomonas morindae]
MRAIARAGAPDRRQALALVLGAPAALMSCASAPVAPTPLREHARARGMRFGLALRPEDGEDPRTLALVTREADSIVSDRLFKWASIEAERDRPDFTAADALAEEAAARGLGLRGHAGFWYRSIPAWLRPDLADGRANGLIVEHVRAMVARYRGRIFEWDVLNEVIEPDDRQPLGLRAAPFGRAPDLGLYVDCFAAARAADPHARLYLNDYGVECDSDNNAARRTCLLKLVEALKARGAPLDAIGIQSHLATNRRFSARIFRDFLGELAGLGCAIKLTEFDVCDTGVRGDTAARDRAVADYARRFLDAAFDEPRVIGLVAWGVRDGGSWLQQEAWARRADGAPLRPLPFDDAGRRTPLWTAIAASFDGASAR